MEATHTFEVAASPEEVWRYLADPMRWPDWMETVKSVEPLDGVTAPGVGAGYKLQRKGDFAGECHITTFDAPRTLAYTLSGTSTPTSAVFGVADPGNGRSQVTLAMEVGAISGAVLTIFAGGRGGIEDQFAADGDNLRALVERA